MLLPAVDRLVSSSSSRDLRFSSPGGALGRLGSLASQFRVQPGCPLCSWWLRTDLCGRCTNFLLLWWCSFSYSPLCTSPAVKIRDRNMREVAVFLLLSCSEVEGSVFFSEKACYFWQQEELLRCLVASSCVSWATLARRRDKSPKVINLVPIRNLKKGFLS